MQVGQLSMNLERRIGSDCHTYITYRYRAFMAVDVTDATFETEVLVQSHQVPVIVDLWAPWCGPCKTLGPILEKATDATMGQVVLAKVNVDENPQISQAFQVKSIPAVFIMKDGKVLDSFVGAQPEHVVLQIVQSLLPDPTAEKFKNFWPLVTKTVFGMLWCSHHIKKTLFVHWPSI